MRVPELLPIAVPSLDGYEATGAPAPPSRVGIWLVEWVVVVVLALVLAVGVRTYVAQMFYIPSGSMLPTLQIGDRIVVDKLSYRLHPVHRGDVVVFRRPPLEHANYSDLVKRVIGLPGETVSSVDGQVYIDGKPLDEPWLPEPHPLSAPSPVAYGFSLSHPYVVPAGEYFVMGDNRADSEDSRYFGPIPASLMVGKMAFTAWPISDETWLVILSIVAGVILILGLVALRRTRVVDPDPGVTLRGPPVIGGPHGA